LIRHSSAGTGRGEGEEKKKKGGLDQIDAGHGLRKKGREGADPFLTREFHRVHGEGGEKRKEFLSDILSQKREGRLEGEKKR